MTNPRLDRGAMRRAMSVAAMTAMGASVWAAAHSIDGDTLPAVAITAEAASAHGLRLTSTTATMTLDGKQMEQLGVRGVADALRLAGGVAVRDYGGLGGMKTVSLRGLGAQHTAILYDGVPISNCQAGQIDLSRFPVDGVAGIELFIGQTDDLLAPAMLGAYSGGINLTMTHGRPGWDSDSTRIGASAQLSYASWHTVEASAAVRGVHAPSSHARPAVPAHGLSARVHYLHTDGDYPFTLTNGQTHERLHRDGGRVDAIDGELNHHAQGSDWTVDTKAYYYYSDRGLPGAVIYYVNEGTERLWDENFFAQSRAAVRLSERWQIRGAVKYNHSWNKYHDRSLEGASGAMSTYRYRQDEWLATVSALCRPTAHIVVAAAHDEQLATLRSNIPECPYPLRWTTWSTVRGQWHTTLLTVQAALLLTSVRESQQSHLPDGSAAARGEVQPLASDHVRLSPSVAASWQPLHGVPLRLRGSWRQAFRLPSFNDLYYYRLGNHNLRPEQADEASVGLTLAWGDYRTTGVARDDDGSGLAADAVDEHPASRHGVALSVDIYQNDVTDKIVAFPTTFAWRMANYGRVRLRGVDVGLNVRFAVRATRLSLASHYSLCDAANRTDRSSMVYDNQIPYTPRHCGNTSVSLAMPWLTLGYTMVWQGERFSNPMATRRYRLEPYIEQSVSASRAFAIGHSSLVVRASIYNVADSQYEIVQYYPMTGRGYGIGLRWVL